jgi:uncharacterized SAM-binding protein YcdF (DUF218 family)
MHRIGATIFSFILSPTNWIILLIILQFVFKNERRKYLYILSALVIFLIFSNPILMNEYAKWWQPKPRDISKDNTYSCAIVLGGFGSPDANDSGYFNSSSDRFIQTLKLYKLGKIQHILISGGNGKLKKKAFSEADFVKNEFITMGVPDSVILQEDRSNNTSDNVKWAKKLLDSVHLKPPYLLVTSAYHIPRAAELFKHAGLNIVGFPCNYIAGKDSYDISSIIPRMDILLCWDFYLKETAGYCIYYFKGK